MVFKKQCPFFRSYASFGGVADHCNAILGTFLEGPNREIANGVGYIMKCGKNNGTVGL